MKKLLFSLSLVLSMTTVIVGSTYAQESPSLFPPIQPGTVKTYGLLPPELPNVNNLSLKDLEKLSKDRASRRVMFREGQYIHLEEITISDDPIQAEKNFAKAMVEMRYHADQYGLKLKNWPIVNKQEIADATMRVCNAIEQSISKPLKESAEKSVGSTTFTERLDGLDKDIEVINGHISSVWINSHGYDGIALKLKLSPLSHKWELFDGNRKITGINFAIVIGNLGGIQGKRVIKIYALALEPDGEYTVLMDANVDGGSVNPNQPILMDGIEYDVFLQPISDIPRNNIQTFLGMLNIPKEGISGLFRNDQYVAVKQ